MLGNFTLYSSSSLSFEFELEDVCEQVTNLYNSFKSLDEEVFVDLSNTDYLKAKDILPLFNSREVIFD